MNFSNLSASFKTALSDQEVGETPYTCKKRMIAENSTLPYEFVPTLNAMKFQAKKMCEEEGIEIQFLGVEYSAYAEGCRAIRAQLQQIPKKGKYVGVILHREENPDTMRYLTANASCLLCYSPPTGDAEYLVIDLQYHERYIYVPSSAIASALYDHPHLEYRKLEVPERFAGRLATLTFLRDVLIDCKTRTTSFTEIFKAEGITLTKPTYGSRLEPATLPAKWLKTTNEGRVEKIEYLCQYMRTKSPPIGVNDYRWCRVIESKFHKNKPAVQFETIITQNTTLVHLGYKYLIEMNVGQTEIPLLIAYYCVPGMMTSGMQPFDGVTTADQG